MDDWIKACAEEELLRDFGGEELWHCAMNMLRWVLHPQDVVAAIAAKAWEPDSSFVPDKERYLARRGVFDEGAHGDMDWFSFHERDSSINALGLGGGPEYPYSEGRSWWDEYRSQKGSPFHQSFDWDALLSASPISPRPGDLLLP